MGRAHLCGPGRRAAHRARYQRRRLRGQRERRAQPHGLPSDGRRGLRERLRPADGQREGRRLQLLRGLLSRHLLVPLRRAFSEGAQCLRAAAELSLRSIARAQLPDGRWHNEVIRQDGDDVLATAFALGALLKAGNRSDPSQVAIARKGMVYLLSRVRRRGALAYWPGGVFFSAGSPVRSGVLWRSDSFTTSVVALALFDAAAWLPHGEKCL